MPGRNPNARWEVWDKLFPSERTNPKSNQKPDQKKGIISFPTRLNNNNHTVRSALAGTSPPGCTIKPTCASTMIYKRGPGFPNSLPDCLRVACFSSSCICCNCKFPTCESEESSGPVDVTNYGSLAVLQFAPHVARRRPWSIWGSHGEPASVLQPLCADSSRIHKSDCCFQCIFIHKIVIFRAINCLRCLAINVIRFNVVIAHVQNVSSLWMVSTCSGKNRRRSSWVTVKFNFDPHQLAANFQAGWLKLEERENTFCSRAENKYMEIFSGASFPLRLALQK